MTPEPAVGIPGLAIGGTGGCDGGGTGAGGWALGGAGGCDVAAAGDCAGDVLDGVTGWTSADFAGCVCAGG